MVGLVTENEKRKKGFFKKSNLGTTIKNIILALIPEVLYFDSVEKFSDVLEAWTLLPTERNIFSIM